MAVFKRILVPLDGSQVAEQTLGYMRWLGRRLEAPIELLRVIEPIPHELVNVAERASLERVESDLRARSEDYLESVAGPMREGGLQVSCTVLEGQPAFGIVSAAEKVPHTLIAMSTHGRTGIDRWLLGSVTDKVSHSTSAPLLVIRSTGDVAKAESAILSGILVPLDGSNAAEQVLPHVVGLAKPLGLSVTLARVTPDPGAFFGYLYDSASITEEMSVRVDAHAEEYMAKVSESLRSQGVVSTQRVLHGDPATELLRIAGETPNTAVAMVTHGTSGVGSWVIGAVTSRVIRYSSGPTLVVRADEETLS